MTVKIGFFSNAFKHYSLEYAVDCLSSLGYVGLELWCKGQHVTPYDGPERTAYVKGLAASKGLEIYGLSAHLDFITDNSEMREENIRRFKKVIDLASAYGVRKVQTASGYLHGREPEEWMWDNFRDSMERVGEHARERGITINIEPEPEKLLRTPEQLLRFIDEIGIPVFKGVADLSHAIALDMTPVEYMERMEGHLNHVHVDDGRYGQHPHRHLIPGEGDVDYHEVFEYLESIKYHDHVSVELNQHTEHPCEAAKKTMDFLRKEGFAE
ncbi:MAG: sugar phosphate isomerase/epimerase [Methanobacteriota archaeon]|nr:MAG: sugar phosphate isomerase/epimerase [Euryarchaeota archaeon]